MTDYRRAAMRSRSKRLALALLKIRPLNAMVVRSLRALPASGLRRRVPVIGAEGRFETGNGPVVMSDAERCEIAKELFWGDGRLDSGADRLALDLAMRLSRGASLFLDIGSYSGLFALAAARANPGVVSHAFEIVPENFLLLWRNVIGNDLVDRVRPRLLGIGARPGHIRVPVSFGAGVLPSSVALDSEAADGGVAVPLATLDSLFPDFDGRAVMKIDVEGFEWPVLQGGTGLIARTGPDMICEILLRAPDVAPLQEALSGHGYGFFRISAGGLVHRERIEPVKHERDWLFTRRAPGDLETAGVTVLDGR